MIYSRVRKLIKTKYLLLFFFLLVNVLSTSAQNGIGIHIKDFSQAENLFNSFKKVNPKVIQRPLATYKPKIAPTHSIMYPEFQPKHYGLFCKIEEKIEIKSKVPVRFRLGSLDYVNQLEQKYSPEGIRVTNQ